MDLPERPVYSLAERDRRFRRIRAFMTEQGLDALVVGGFRGRESYEAYVANESIQGAVVFPGSRDPVYLTWSAFRVVGRSDPDNDRPYWIEDIRAGRIGPLLVDVLREAGVAEGRVGVVGLRSRNPMELEGFIPYGVWETVLRELPKAEFVEVSAPFALLMMEKGEEEIRAARWAAAVGERACQVMLEATRPGVSEAEIYARVVAEMLGAGVTLTPPLFILKSGYERLAWGPPEWGVGDVPPRRVGQRELVYGELMPTYAGIETQQQVTIALAPLDPAWRRLEDAARRAYEAGLEALRPGVTFKELCEAMWRPVREAGFWHLSPLVHSLAPAAMIGYLHGDAEKVFADRYPWFRTIPPSLDAPLKEGMLFSFEPNACSGRHRVNIGGTVLLGKSGPEELNHLPCRMLVVE